MGLSFSPTFGLDVESMHSGRKAEGTGTSLVTKGCWVWLYLSGTFQMVASSRSVALEPWEVKTTVKPGCTW